MKTRMVSLLGIVVLAVAAGVVQADGAGKKLPNILVITTDQQFGGWLKEADHTYAGKP